ncbi:MAG: ATP-binding cassette domain-containing protein [Spirochaetales bacterium]
MSKSQLSFSSVSFSYDSLATPLVRDLSFVASAGWTGIVGPNGVGKTTLLQLAAGALEPQAGSVSRPAPVVVCEQRTDFIPTALTDLLRFETADAGRLISILGIEVDWPYRWDTLSYGERKRAQIGSAMYAHPELFIVDEPTNHLDRDARLMLREALEGFEGVGLIVSHDRELLDGLCSHCLFLSPHRPPAMRPGGVTQGLAAQGREDHERRDRYSAAVAAERKIVAEAARRREKAASAHKMRSKRNLSRKDSDGREKIDRARISGQDGAAGRLLSQLEGRIAQAQAARDEASDAPVHERVGISVSGSRANSDAIVKLETMAIPIGQRTLHVPAIHVRPEDRIGVVGPNGTGKSTLIAELMRRIGRNERVLYIPQELSANEAASALRELKHLPNDKLGEAVSIFARLGSDPEQLLESTQPSPGEARKILLALGLLREPHLIVMDEPTNHMDLVSIECLEKALQEYVGALLLVSHDLRFLETLAPDRWEIRRGDDANCQLLTL